MLREFEPKLWKQLRQLSCDAHKCDGAINQDREMCQAIHVLSEFYSRTHSEAIHKYLIQDLPSNKSVGGPE